MGDAELIDSMVHDGLWDAFNDIHNGDHRGEPGRAVRHQPRGAGRVRRASQQKAERAVAEGIFVDEIVPIEVPAKGGTRTVHSDEHPRAGTTAGRAGEAAHGVPPRRRHGDRGQRLGVNDGAAAIVVMSASKASERGLRTFGTVESHASVGVEPKIMGIGPVPAVRKALARAGLQLATSTCSSSNEAFAAQSLAVLRELEIDPNGSTPMVGRSRSGTRSEQAAAGSRHPLARDAPPQRSARPRHALHRGGQGQAAVIRNGAKH